MCPRVACGWDRIFLWAFLPWRKYLIFLPVLFFFGIIIPSSNRWNQRPFCGHTRKCDANKSDDGDDVADIQANDGRRWFLVSERGFMLVCAFFVSRKTIFGRWWKRLCKKNLVWSLFGVFKSIQTILFFCVVVVEASSFLYCSSRASPLALARQAVI